MLKSIRLLQLAQVEIKHWMCQAQIATPGTSKSITLCAQHCWCKQKYTSNTQWDQELTKVLFLLRVKIIKHTVSSTVCHSWHKQNIKHSVRSVTQNILSSVQHTWHRLSQLSVESVTQNIKDKTKQTQYRLSQLAQVKYNHLVKDPWWPLTLLLLRSPVRLSRYHWVQAQYCYISKLYRKDYIHPGFLTISSLGPFWSILSISHLHKLWLSNCWYFFPIIFSAKILLDALLNDMWFVCLFSFFPWEQCDRFCCKNNLDWGVWLTPYNYKGLMLL